MPRPRIHKFWVDRIQVLAAAEPSGKASATKIQSQLKQEEPGAPTAAPSDRSIRRVLEEWKEKPEAERQPYFEFSWPESMLNDSIPWEASRVALDFLRFHAESGLPTPLIRDVLWFWRVSLAVPDAPLENRLWITGHLMALERSEPRSEGAYRGTQWELAFQPWSSDEARNAFEALPASLRRSPAAYMTAGRAIDVMRFDHAVASRSKKVAGLEGEHHGRQRSKKGK